MGGNAFNIVSMIEQKNIQPTIDIYIIPILNKLGIHNWKLLGSALKKNEPSGDLDIGILWSDLLINFDLDDKEFSKSSIEHIFSITNIEYEVKTFGSLFTIMVPIVNQENEFVQVDFMIFDDLDYAELTKLAPEKGTSKYKSRVKNFLWYSILMFLRFDEKYLNDELIEYKQYITNDKGLFLKTSSRIGKRGINKNFKTIDRKFISNDWNEIWKMFLGKKFKRKDWNSFESLLEYMKSDNFKYKSYINEIIEIAKTIMEENKENIIEF